MNIGAITAVIGAIAALATIAATVVTTIHYVLTHPSSKREVVIIAIFTTIVITITIFTAVFIVNLIGTSTGGGPVVQLRQASPTPTPSPTATPIPTPTPTIISINQTMTCTNCDSSDNFSLNVKNAEVDSANNQVTLLIGVQNNSTYTGEQQFRYIKLQDLQTGVTTDGVGDGFNGFEMTTNQLVLVRPTFQFIPISGHQYSLSADLTGITFSPITIKLG